MRVFLGLIFESIGTSCDSLCGVTLHFDTLNPHLCLGCLWCPEVAPGKKLLHGEG